MEYIGKFVIGHEQPETVQVTLKNVAHWQTLSDELADLGAQCDTADPDDLRTIDERRAEIWEEMGNEFNNLLPTIPTPACKFDVIATFDGIDQQNFHLWFMEDPTEGVCLYHALGCLDELDRYRLTKLSVSQIGVDDMNKVMPWLRSEGRPFKKHGEYYFNEHLA